MVRRRGCFVLTLLLGITSYCEGSHGWQDGAHGANDVTGATENYGNAPFTPSSGPSYGGGDMGGFGGSEMGAFGDVNPYRHNDVGDFGGAFSPSGAHGYGDSGGPWDMDRPVKTVVKHKVKNIAIPHPVPAPVPVPIPKFVRYFKPFPVAKPVAVPEVVPVIKHIQKPVAYFTSIPVARSVPVPKFIRLPIQVRVPRPILVRVPKIVPVAKKFPIPVTVHVPKPYIVPVFKNIPVPVPHKVPKIINVIREVPEIVKKPVPVYVDNFGPMHESANFAAYGNSNPGSSFFQGGFSDDDFEDTYAAGMGGHGGRYPSYHGSSNANDVSGHYHGQEYRQNYPPPRAHRSQSKSQQKQRPVSSTSDSSKSTSSSSSGSGQTEASPSYEVNVEIMKTRQNSYQNGHPHAANTAPATSSLIYPRNPSYAYNNHAAHGSGYPYSSTNAAQKFYDTSLTGLHSSSAGHYGSVNGHVPQQQYPQNGGSYTGSAHYSQPEYSQSYSSPLSQALQAYDTGSLQKPQGVSEASPYGTGGLSGYQENHLPYDQSAYSSPAPNYGPVSDPQPATSYGSIPEPQQVSQPQQPLQQQQQYSYGQNEIPQTNSVSYHYSTSFHGKSPLNGGDASFSSQGYTIFHPPTFTNLDSSGYQAAYPAGGTQHSAYPNYDVGGFADPATAADQVTYKKGTDDAGYASKGSGYSNEDPSYFSPPYDGTGSSGYDTGSRPGSSDSPTAYSTGEYSSGSSSYTDSNSVPGSGLGSYDNKGSSYSHNDNAYPSSSDSHSGIIDQISSYTASFSTTHSLSSTAKGDSKAKGGKSESPSRLDSKNDANPAASATEENHQASSVHKPQYDFKTEIQYSPAYSQPEDLPEASHNSSVVHLKTEASSNVVTSSSRNDSQPQVTVSGSIQRSATDIEDITSKLKDIFLYSPLIETESSTKSKPEPLPQETYKMTGPNPQKKNSGSSSATTASLSDIFLQPSQAKAYYTHKLKATQSGKDDMKAKHKQEKIPSPIFIAPPSTTPTEKSTRSPTKTPTYWSPPIFKTVPAKNVGQELYSSQDLQVVAGPSNAEKGILSQDPSPAYKAPPSSSTTMDYSPTASPAFIRKLDDVTSTTAS